MRHMRLQREFSQVCLGTLFVVIALGQWAHAAALGEPKPKLEATWDNRLMTRDVVDADVREMIRAVSEKSGIEIYEGVTGKVSLREEKAPLEKEEE